jgi:hypothetical protein
MHNIATATLDSENQARAGRTALGTSANESVIRSTP